MTIRTIRSDPALSNLRRLAAAALILAIAACTTTPRLEKQAGLRFDPPIIVEDVLGVWDAPPFRSTQLVVTESHGTSFQALFEIEWLDRVLTIVAMTPMGLLIFEVQASATGIHLTAGLEQDGTNLNPAWVLSDFLLATAPTLLLRPALRDSFATFGLENRTRQLIGADGSVLITLTYADDKFLTSRLKIDNHLVGYRLVIDTLQFEVIE